MDAHTAKTVFSLPQGRSAEAAAEPAAPSVEPSEAAERLHSGRRHARSGSLLPARRSPFVPVLLGTLALLAWLGFQTMQLLVDRSTLMAAHFGQQQTVDNAGKLRSSLDALAGDTQRMADAGNGSARLLVEELRKRGVTINPSAAQAPTAAATSAR